MRNLLFWLISLFSLPLLFAQNQPPRPIDPGNITIIRDRWGVPHIYASTDAEVAYGLAWAQSEDNFATVQEPFFAVRGRLSRVKGKEGALMDAVCFLTGAREVVEEKFETDLSPGFRQVLDGFAQGLNDYAAAHPDEVLEKGVFPVNAKDAVTVYVTYMTFISNVHYDLLRIFGDDIAHQEEENFHRGSNAFAMNRDITDNGKTFLVSNSHQPLRGPVSWYEVHVHSEEGWEFYGATFAGGVTPFVGTNRHLGWTHTINFGDYNDIYKLEMHPKKKLRYRFDGEWRELEERVLRLKVRVGPVRVPIRRKFYRSVHGPAIRNKDGFYALRFPSNMVVHAAEQWYRMNKARDRSEFMEAMAMQGFTNQNVIYADQEGNILYIDNGLFPRRDPRYNWQGVVPGDTSATLWEPEFLPLDSLLVVENPSCGYLFNCNNTPFNCTCEAENRGPEDFSPNVRYQPKNTARALRVAQLMEGRPVMSYEDLKALKYDQNLRLPLYTRSIENLDMIRQVDPAEHPGLADVIAHLEKWDGSVAADNRQAAIISLSIQYMLEYIRDHHVADYNNTLPEKVFPEALRFAKKHLRKHFGTIDIALGDLQKHRRGDKVLPLWGTPEALTQMYTVPWKKGLYESYLGECFILFATYGEEGVERIETIQPYGASNRPESPHYTDQMEMFVQRKLKPVSMDREVIRENAERIYHPGE